MDELIAWTEVHDVPVTLENHLALAFGAGGMRRARNLGEALEALT
jgi:hypothetical protein